MGDDADFAFAVEPLAERHDRVRFTCGVESLDRYLKTQASQDIRRKANAVLVMVAPREPSRILGYFTLCACGLSQGAVPEGTRRHLPRYPQVSATLLGRLAVDRDHQGRGIGGLLLARALRLAYLNTAAVGSCMVVVDALDDNAALFYARHGFIRLPDSMRLILPMATVGKLIIDVECREQT